MLFINKKINTNDKLTDVVNTFCKKLEITTRDSKGVAFVDLQVIQNEVGGYVEHAEIIKAINKCIKANGYSNLIVKNNRLISASK